jgi:hypothetical protein
MSSLSQGQHRQEPGHLRDLQISWVLNPLGHPPRLWPPGDSAPATLQLHTSPLKIQISRKCEWISLGQVSTSMIRDSESSASHSGTAGRGMDVEAFYPLRQDCVLHTKQCQTTCAQVFQRWRMSGWTNIPSKSSSLFPTHDWLCLGALHFLNLWMTSLRVCPAEKGTMS